MYTDSSESEAFGEDPYQPKDNELEEYAEGIANYHICAKTFQYNKVPYTKVKVLKFTENTSVVLYKTSSLEKNFQDATIARKTRKSGDAPCYDPVMPKVKLAKKGTLSAEKKSDLISMLKFMPLQDQEYYKALGC